MNIDGRGIDEELTAIHAQLGSLGISHQELLCRATLAVAWSVTELVDVLFNIQEDGLSVYTHKVEEEENEI